MFLPLLLALSIVSDSTLVYSGREKRTHVQIPRIDTTIIVDGGFLARGV